MLQELWRVGLVTGPELEKEVGKRQPSIDDRVAVRVGFYVQVMLRAETFQEPASKLTERLWLKVTDQKGLQYTGIVVNQPRVLHDYFSRGSEVKFSAEHITDVEKPRAPQKLS